MIAAARRASAWSTTRGACATPSVVSSVPDIDHDSTWTVDCTAWMVPPNPRHNAPMALTAPIPGRWKVATALVIVYIVWGSTYLGIAVMVQTLPPLVSAGIRYAMAGVILLLALVAWHRLRGTPFERPSRTHWRSAIVIGALLLLGGNGGVVLGETLIASGVAALVVATTPIWMAIFEAIVAGERPSRLTVAGLVAGTTGVAILVVPLEGSVQIDPLGLALVAGAAISWSIGSVYSRRVPMPRSPFQGAGLEMLAGGLIMLAVGLIRGELGAVNPAEFSTESLVALVYLIVFGSLVAFTAYIWLLNNAAITVVSTTAYVNPIVAVALGILILNEPMEPRTWLAAAIIIGAVVAIVTGRPRPASEPEPSVEPEPKPA
jgi:drug/metabolite transporter (DMT)-like permease